jgi:glycosyltransferase involved in cell wall biosynthesis
MEFITRQQIMTHPRFKIDWFHLGADIPKSANSVGLPSEARATLKGLSQRPSILLVGTVEPRKGHAQSLRAVELLWAAGHDVNLVIVGKEGWRVEALVERLRSHPERGKRLYWLEGISDEYLEQVYQACDVLLAASEGEGFGLPLIEAAQKRIPLLVRDIPVFREVAGVSADYFVNSSDPEVLADTLLQWLVKHKSGAVIKSDDMHWLTWDQSADQFVKRMIL